MSTPGRTFRFSDPSLDGAGRGGGPRPEPGVRLLAITPTMDSALQRGAFERRYGVRLGVCGDLVADVVTQTLGMLQSKPRDSRLGGYLAINDGGLVIGTCGFRAAPGARGEVELAYYTFPMFEGQGYATAMGRALIQVARGVQGVHGIVAHTLAQPGPSPRILEKLGFAFAGPVEDPEDGVVWRYERTLGN